MDRDLYEINRQLLQNLMQQTDLADIDELATRANVPRLQLIRIERGLILNLPLGAIAKIARALNISVDKLLATFVPEFSSAVSSTTDNTDSLPKDALETCRAEYHQLQQSMAKQAELLQTEFQAESLATIESWLLQWPTAATAVRQNPQLPASRLLALVEPVTQLLQQWNVEAIAEVGEELPYDPQNHELMKGLVRSGELVKVRYVGYRQGDKILHKAKVSPIF